MNLTVDLTWPEDLPLPDINFSGVPRNSTLVSPAENASIARRSRFERSYSVLTVGWTFTVAQNAIFKAFFLDDLGNGSAQFKIELRHPLQSALTWWEVRFAEGYQETYDDGFWTVQASLELTNPIAF